jgi:hypothetical protein
MFDTFHAHSGNQMKPVRVKLLTVPLEWTRSAWELSPQEQSCTLTKIKNVLCRRTHFYSPKCIHVFMVKGLITFGQLPTLAARVQDTDTVLPVLTKVRKSGDAIWLHALISAPYDVVWSVTRPGHFFVIRTINTVISASGWSGSNQSINQSINHAAKIHLDIRYYTTAIILLIYWNMSRAGRAQSV